MKVARTARHLLTTPWAVKRAFPAHTMESIARAIRETERSHVGQIRFAVEHALEPRELRRDVSAHDRAVEVFSELRVWDTEHNNGVLIYVLLADRDVEIVADRGIHARAGTEAWETICRQMEEAFRRGEFESGVVRGIHAVGQHLTAAFPRRGTQANELPDEPVIV
jgi:uncharacterized membrane protein